MVSLRVARPMLVVSWWLEVVKVVARAALTAKIPSIPHEIIFAFGYFPSILSHPRITLRWAIYWTWTSGSLHALLEYLMAKLIRRHTDHTTPSLSL